MDIRQTLLAGTAAIALAAGANFAIAQSPGGSMGGGAEKTQGTQQGQGTRGAQEGTRGGAQGGATRGQAQERGGSFGEGQQRGESQRDGQRDMQRGQARETEREGKRERDSAGEQRQERGKAAEQRREKNEQRGTAEQRGKGASDRETTGSAPATVTTEQRTRIREHRSALARGRVERTQINFNISVGTTVPRSVTLYTLPPTIIEVVPAWRSYRYILVEEEIVIIDPSSYRIVAVIEV